MLSVFRGQQFSRGKTNQLITILAALDRELTPIIRRTAVTEQGQTDAMAYWLGRFAGTDAVLVRTGVGPAKARAATESVVTRFRPELIVSVGYAGGLVDSLRPAMLVVGEGAIRRGARLPLPPEGVEGAVSVAEELGVPFQKGWLITVDKPLITPESKRSAHDEWGALAVEMETGEVARVAADAGVPCIALRAISDTSEQSLHVVGKCVVSRRTPVALARIALHLMRHPTLIPHAWRLHRQGGQCSARLVAVVERLAERMYANAASEG